MLGLLSKSGNIFRCRHPSCRRPFPAERGLKIHEKSCAFVIAQSIGKLTGDDASSSVPSVQSSFTKTTCDGDEDASISLEGTSEECTFHCGPCHNNEEPSPNPNREVLGPNVGETQSLDSGDVNEEFFDCVSEPDGVTDGILDTPPVDPDSPEGMHLCFEPIVSDLPQAGFADEFGNGHAAGTSPPQGKHDEYIRPPGKPKHWFPDEAFAEKTTLTSVERLMTRLCDLSRHAKAPLYMVDAIVDIFKEEVHHGLDLKRTKIVKREAFLAHMLRRFPVKKPEVVKVELE
jgi:hypothetical protein